MYIDCLFRKRDERRGSRSPSYDRGEVIITTVSLNKDNRFF
jgi:hypothetical protein